MTLTELRERADRATPGPRIRPWGSDQLWAPGAHGIFDYGVVGPTQAQRNLDFAAACSPEVIKALVAAAQVVEYIEDQGEDCCHSGRCYVCRSWDGHEGDCPLPALDALREALA